ncbi:MAG TPA: lysophospholipid acyltransferase family protein [Thermoanaerobaculia bacterium]
MPASGFWTVFRERAAFVIGFAAGGIWFVLVAAVSLIALPLAPKKGRPGVVLYARLACGTICRVMGWKIEVDHTERFYANRPCVFVCNHQSIMDVLVLGAIVPRGTVAVAKKEILKVPFFGWFFRASGNLTIDRGNTADAREMLRRAATRLREEQINVWFMPEGHRSKGSTQLLPFKTGAFRLAVTAGVPIVPVVAAPLTKIVDTGALRTRPGRLEIRVLDAIDTAGLSEDEAVALASKVRERMQEAFNALAREGSS